VEFQKGTFKGMEINSMNAFLGDRTSVLLHFQGVKKNSGCATLGITDSEFISEHPFSGNSLSN
jgi:hypothetical protein